MSESVLLLAFTVKVGQAYPPKIALMNVTATSLKFKSSFSHVGIFHDSSSAFGQIEKSLNG